jgi:predicted RecA/RadA family phage recombinase
MAQSFIQEGNVITIPAPSGGVTVGTAYLVGRLLVIAKTTAAQTVDFDGYVSGIHLVTKADSQAWTVGANVYWDDTGKNFTTTATSNNYAGVAVEAVAATAGLVTGKILLNGIGIKAAG